MDEEINLLDYFSVINRYRGLIITLCVMSVLLTMIVSLLMPKTYESTVTILSPQGGSSAGGSLASLPELQSAMGIMGIGQKTSLDIFMAILNSRNMADAVIKRFNLLMVYKVKLIENARLRLKNVTRISVGKKNESLSITVQDTDPKRAAGIANFYASNLDIMARGLALSQAQQARMFIEKRLQETEMRLRDAEERSAGFKTQHELVEIGEQAKASIGAAAQIEGEITASEVQLKVMQSYATAQHPDVLKLRLKIEQLKKQLGKMKSGKESLYIPFSKTPSLGLGLTRLMRELKIQETVFELLTQQYEQAKISEARDTPSVQILDKAVPSAKKCKPKIRTNMMIAGTLSLFIGVFMAFFLEYLKRIKSSTGIPACEN
ncbi:MAG: GNVR domain-containing protein [bacterium]|nr:GNVR domain-containing protein [bacterium]